MAGVYDKDPPCSIQSESWGPFMQYWGDAQTAKQIQIETCLIPLPNFLHVQFTLDGERLDMTTGNIKRMTRRLDLRSGLFTARRCGSRPEAGSFASWNGG